MNDVNFKKVYISGIFAVICTIILAWSIASIRPSNTPISVTGSAKIAVKADKVKWTGSWSRIVTVDSMKSGYTSMATDEKIVRDFLKANKIGDASINISAVSMNEKYDYNKNYGQQEYTLTQNVVINSDDIEGITNLTKSTKALVDNGVIFSTYNPQYYYSKLPELRVSLLADAIKDAKARAQVISKAGGKSLGNLISASSGVVQVLPPNSLDISDYGSYDTESIDKEVMVTVKASFEIK